jgi:diguanylate cyclase (GGDEF)-like protein/PAS domain S-box-containing protein
LRLVGTLQDISGLRQVENRLKMLKEAVDSLPIGITLSDINGRIVYSNPAEARMHGYDVEELIGREAREFASNDLHKPFQPEKTREFGVWRRESVNIRKNGEEFPVQLMSMSVLDSQSRWLGTVTTCEDISEKKETEGKIHRLAYFDLLTGLPNRGMFLDRLQQALSLAHREGDKVSLVFLDLDNFKDVNDTQGHDFGDKLLRQVAVRLTDCMRESDTLARFGGDEFVVVLTSVHSHACVATAAQRILSAFSQPFEIDGRQIYSSASLGIALYPDDCKDASSLFRCADTAMYNAKNEGRSQFRFFSKEMNQKIMRRVALENSLRRGLEKKEFFLLYQPQWDLKSSRMVGVEVLLRWQSEDFGLMPPSEFISLTEDSGLIFSIGVGTAKRLYSGKRWAMDGLGF